MSLHFDNGETFADIEVPYLYRPASQGDSSPRIRINIWLDQFQTEAFLDTGGVFLLCSPDIQSELVLDDSQKLEDRAVLFRGVTYHGGLYRVPVRIASEEGATLYFEATAFVPDERYKEQWPIEIPCILGMHGCMERTRFAVDPRKEMLYVGEG